MFGRNFRDYGTIPKKLRNTSRMIQGEFQEQSFVMHEADKVLPCKPFKTLTDAYANKDKFWDTLKLDVLAGTTVGIMVIPQSMAYALIAGLPGEYGLYSSFIPLLIYAATGSSRQLAIGPVAIISLLTKASLSFIDPNSPDYTSAYITAAITLAFFGGLAQAVLGCLRLGFVVNLMSHCVISGFTSAADCMQSSTSCGRERSSGSLSSAG